MAWPQGGGTQLGRWPGSKAATRSSGNSVHPGLRHRPCPPGGCASGPKAAAPPLDIWLSELQRGRSASSSFLYLTLEPRLRRLSSSSFLNFIAQRNLAWKKPGKGGNRSSRALALASKTPREAIEGFVEVEEPC